MPEFKRLSDVANQVLEVFTLRIRDAFIQDGILTIQLPGDPEVITSAKERILHGQSIDSAWIQNQLSQLGSSSKVVVADDQHPLDIASCDICIVLIIGEQRYVVGILRDKWPEGYLAPGGCPKSFNELLNPESVAEREAGEELIITNSSDSPSCYIFRETSEREKDEILLALDSFRVKDISKFVQLSHRKIASVIGHAKSLVIWQNGRRISWTNDANITITPLSGLVSVTYYWEINLPMPLNKLRLFDGERLPNGSFLGRAVQLKQKDKVKAIFVKGIDIFNKTWQGSMMASRIRDPKNL